MSLLKVGVLFNVTTTAELYSYLHTLSLHVCRPSVRVSGLSLADVDSYVHGPQRGAGLVEGGLGGPDAVRQLLAAIPEGFPRPVLVRLHLDGGRYDRLVKQMGRAALLPIALAEAGQSAEAGTVRSEEHTSELQSIMRISYAVFCLQKKKKNTKYNNTTT